MMRQVGATTSSTSSTSRSRASPTPTSERRPGHDDAPDARRHVRRRRAPTDDGPHVRPDGRGFVDRIPNRTGLPAWLSQDELDHYIAEFTRTGFTGGVNWYRNFDRNWETTAAARRGEGRGAVAVHRRRADPVLVMSPPGVDGRPRLGPPGERDRRGRRPLGAAGEARRGQRRAARLPRARPTEVALMRTTSCVRARSSYATTEPEPGPFGQVLVEVKACGICGSDLHFAKHGATMLASASRWRACRRWAASPPIDLDRRLHGPRVLAEVLEVGPDTEAPGAGTLVTSIPVMLTMTGVDPIVYSNDVGRLRRADAPVGADASRGAQRPRLPPRRASPSRWRSGCTPSTGRASPRRGRARARLRSGRARRDRRAEAQGIECIVATDFSPARRRRPPRWGHRGRRPGGEPPSTPGTGRRAALVVFEAIGVPGIIDGVLRDAAGAASSSSASAWSPTRSRRSSASARS